MVCTRRSANQNEHVSCSKVIIQDLFSYFHSSQELELPELKSLYYLLVHLSLDMALCNMTTDKANLSFPERRIGLKGISVPFAAIFNLSDILFKTLSEMFKEFLSTLHNVSESFSELDSLHFNICGAAQRLNLLLRCCLVMLKLLVIDQNRLVENGLVLHAIIAKLCSLHLIKANEQNAIRFEKVSQDYKWDDTHFSLFTEDFVASLQFIEPIDHCRHFFCTMLEVFVDELSSDGNLRVYFELIDSCSTSNKLFMSHPSRGDVGSVLELVCSHFCMSFTDEQTLESIDYKLSGSRRGKLRIPELGPVSALNLLLNPVMLTAPKYLQAHLISLVSESLTSVASLRNDNLLKYYLAAFERSVILYIKHMSPSDKDPICKFSAYKGSSQPSFESYLRPATRKQLDHLVSKLDVSLQLQLEHMCLRSKSELVASSIAHISDSKEFLNTSFKDEIISISSSIILNAFPDEVVDSTLGSGCDTKPGSIYLLASIMKLMSCSLLQATQCLMNTRDLVSSRTLKGSSTCKEHAFLMDVTRRFKKCGISLPVQKSLITALDTYPEKHKESKLMLIHFSGLLSLSYKSGIDVLLKGCISLIISLINLFLFEECNLDAVTLADGSELFSSYLRKEHGEAAVASRRSSLVIASKFEKIRTMYLRPSLASRFIGIDTETSPGSLISNGTPCVIGIEEETEVDCNGSFYLKCVMNNVENEPDFDDLADFVECKKGKDYLGWLKNRQMYRKKKGEKMAVIKWKRKKRTWKYLKAIKA